MEPAGDGENDDTLYEGVIKCQKDVLIKPKSVLNQKAAAGIS